MQENNTKTYNTIKKNNNKYNKYNTNIKTTTALITPASKQTNKDNTEPFKHNKNKQKTNKQIDT